jgi:hypothetical protein
MLSPFWPGFQKRKDEVLLAQAVSALDLVGNSHFHELGYMKVFEIR